MASFSIMGDTGQLMTKAKLNYEMKNSYMVTVMANDSSGEANDSATITVTIRVIDQDERPTISGSQDPKHAENDMGTVATFTAMDPERVAPIVWSVDPADFPDRTIDVNGDGDTNDDVDVVAGDMEDNARFKISNAGVLTFKEKPNFEAADDDNSFSNDNNYQVVVQASDGATMETLGWYKVTVEVTDVEETGKVTWMVDPDSDGDEPSQDLLQFQAGAVLTAMVTDPDGPSTVTDIEWQWYRSSSMSAQGAAISNAESASYTPTDTPNNSDVDMYLRAMATYTDRRGDNKEAEFVSPIGCKQPERVPTMSPSSLGVPLREG